MIWLWELLRRLRERRRFGLALGCAACLYVAGCAPVGGRRVDDPSPDHKPSPNVTSSIWSALADRIDKGQVRDSDELLSIVKDLKAAGDVTDTTPFSDALPTLGASNVLFDTPENRKPIVDALRNLK